MAEGPGAVRGGALGGGHGLPDTLALGELLGVDDVVGHEDLGVRPVIEVLVGGAGEDVEGLLRLGDLGLPLLLLLGLRLFDADDAEDLGEFVEQRGIRLGPVVRLDGTVRSVAAQQCLPGELVIVGRGGVHGLTGTVESGEDLLGGQRRPESVEGLEDLFLAAEILTQLGPVGGGQQILPAERIGTDLVGHGVPQAVEGTGEEPLPGLVVRTPRPARGGPGGLHHRRGEMDRHPVDKEGHWTVRYGLQFADGVAEDAHHLRRPLDLLGQQRFSTHRTGGDARVEGARSRQHHAGLTEARQDLGDVVEEAGVGADDEDARPLQLLAPRVQEVGGPVEGDGGLAGARATLDDSHSAVVLADDPVLFRDDGVDDVGHVPRAGAVHRIKQCALLGDGTLTAVGGHAGVGAVPAEPFIGGRGDGAS